MTEKKPRFTIDYFPEVHMIRIIDNWIEEPNGWSMCNIAKTVKELNKLNKENEQLKKRNNNQYNQLNQLWQLIEAKNWETLTGMVEQMKKDEERLQQEWKCYE